MSIRERALAVVLVLTAVPGGPLIAQESAPGTIWPVPGVAALTTEFVLEAYVTIGPAVRIGESDHGTRQFIPITGGQFVGAGIRGEVIAGGADWQLTRPDGTTELTAIYALRTDDGTVIQVENLGISSMINAAGGGTRYLRSSPRFHAPLGPYQWLNEAVFVGSVTPDPAGGAVTIRVFRVL